MHRWFRVFLTSLFSAIYHDSPVLQFLLCDDFVKSPLWSECLLTLHSCRCSKTILCHSFNILCFIAATFVRVQPFHLQLTEAQFSRACWNLSGSNSPCFPLTAQGRQMFVKPAPTRGNNDSSLIPHCEDPGMHQAYNLFDS